jgi:hypothetical protein
MAEKKTLESVDTRDEIIAHLKEIRRPLAWIAKPNTDIPYGSIYSIFEQKVMDLKQDSLDKINKFLGTDFKG